MGETELPSFIELIPEAPLEGLPEIDKLDNHYFVEALNINNQATDQLRVIQQSAIPTIDNLKQLLNNHQTAVTLKLKDIRSVDVLERRFSVSTPLSWSAPIEDV